MSAHHHQTIYFGQITEASQNPDLIDTYAVFHYNPHADNSKSIFAPDFRSIGLSVREFQYYLIGATAGKDAGDIHLCNGILPTVHGSMFPFVGIGNIPSADLEAIVAKNVDLERFADKIKED